MAPDASAAQATTPAIRPSHAVAAVTLVLALFFAPALLGGREFAYRDTGRMHAPMKRWIAEELSAGRFPQWNPYAGLGAPVVANGVDAVQHPFNLFLLALPSRLALKVWILASFALAAASALAWARALGTSHAASALAALAFSLSGPLVSSSDNVQYLTTYAALPLVLAAGHVFVARGGPGRLALVALASALCAAGGDPQSWGLAIGLLPLSSAALAEPNGRRGAALRGLVAAAACVLAAAPFVLPVVAWIGESSRSGGLPLDEAMKWNTHPLRLAELLVPDLFRGDPADPFAPAFAAYVGNDVTPIPWFLSLYVGSGVLALAALGGTRNRSTRWLALATLPIAWAAMGHHAGFRQLVAHLPVVGAFRYWEKITVFLPLLTSVLAARGLDAATNREGVSGLAWGGAIAAAVLLAIAGFAAVAPGAVPAPPGAPPAASAAVAANLASGAARAGLVFAVVALLAARLSRSTRPLLATFGILTVVAVDLVGGNAGAYVLSSPAPQEPPPLARPLRAGDRVLAPFAARDDRWPGMDRVTGTWEWSRRMLDACWNVPLHVGSARDYQGLREGRWDRYRRSLGDGRQLSHLGLFAFTHVSVPGDLALAERAGIALPPVAVASDPELPAWLVELPHRPRAYLAGALAQATADEALAFALSGGEDGRTLVEGSVPPGYAPPSGEARVVRDEPGLTEIEASPSGAALLVLNDSFAPGWTAAVDGRPAPILRANGLVRGIWIDGGRRRVVFNYRTPGLATGWAIALALALGLAGWAIQRRRYAAVRQQPT